MSDNMLQFYRDNDVSPVRQDIQDLERHFQRRKALFFHLGIPPGCVRSRKVLEVGPGSGHNALFMASLRPSHFLLVEGNPKGARDTAKLFSSHPELEKNLVIAQKSFADFTASSSELFDIVWCENVLGGCTIPAKMAVQLSRLVSPGGILVITAMDPISTLPEVVRRYLSYLAIEKCEGLEEKRDRLVPLLESHLRSLRGMSRPLDDWIVDNIILPLSGGYNCFSIPEAVEQLDSSFDFFSSSPKFNTDWRWYKDLSGDQAALNAHAVTEYWKAAHSLIDYRKVFPARPPGENQFLNQACAAFRSAVLEYEEHPETISVDTMQKLLENVISLIRSFSSEVASALEEGKQLMQVIRENPAALSQAKEFSSLFGRTQQHLSFLKK